MISLMGANLKIVATPIGNLDDLSQRAKNTLNECKGILCEDTRRAMALLNALNLTKPVFRCDQNLSLEKIRQLLVTQVQRHSGTWVYLTDAGTPAVSDPGALLVQEARDFGIRVETVPGPSAVAAMVSGSGFTA